MKKLHLFTLLVITLFAMSCKETGKQKEIALEKEKPNILFIFADDQMFNTIGALKDCPVKTPNLDRLMANGVSFSHTYNQGSFSAAVCVASRTMLITGANLWKAASYAKKESDLKKDRNAPSSNSEYEIAFEKPKKYWPQYLKEAGYDAYMAGKWHIPNITPEALFDVTGHVRGGMPNQTEAGYNRSFDQNQPDTWSPYDKALDGHWKGGKHWSEVLADDGISFIEQSKTSDNPFFMYLAFNAPHDPRQAPKKVCRYVPC